MKRCFFIGHRETSEEILPVLTAAVNKHIEEYGVTEFFVGNYGGFDRMAAKAVIAAKERYPEIKSTMLLPYHPAERPIKLPKGFDDSFYPPNMEKVPRRVAIVRANQYMADHVDFLIAHVWHPGSNSMNLVEYANKRAVKYQMKVTLLSL